MDFFNQLVASLPSLSHALYTTVYIVILGCILAAVLSFVLGLMAGAKNVLIRGVARVVIELFRGTSLVVQLFVFYIVVPEITGMTFDSKWVIGVLALGLNYGAYGSEVVRGAINAVPQAQHEATVALNLTYWQKMTRVIVPQAWPEMVPPFSNLAIQLLKGSALVSMIDVADLTYRTDVMAASGGGLMATTALVLVLYFILSYLIATFMRFVERRAKAGIGQVPPKKRKLPQIDTKNLTQAGVG
ncbi:MAG TPA: amino acid ABC transporter permease [Candidatus Stackebrandtia faecavium]|nr:amino acid ABC transporter permease [Candidatus Stackebrandtia faecavium]